VVPPRRPHAPLFLATAATTPATTAWIAVRPYCSRGRGWAGAVDNWWLCTAKDQSCPKCQSQCATDQPAQHALPHRTSPPFCDRFRTDGHVNDEKVALDWHSRDGHSKQRCTLTALATARYLSIDMAIVAWSTVTNVTACCCFSDLVKSFARVSIVGSS
jgi:hypothetical protein